MSLSHSPTESAAARARRWELASPEWPARREALRKSPLARCTSQSRLRLEARNAAYFFPETATESAGKLRRRRSIWCADIFFTRRNPRAERRADRVRLFVALDIPEDVRAAIGALVTKLREHFRDARWVRIEGAHVTLKFIGEVPTEKMEDIRASLRTVPFPAPIQINFRGVGFFPNDRRPRVLWAGIEAGPPLGALAAAVDAALEPCGIAREQRAFSPHLTLARLDSPKNFNRLHERLATAG